MAEFKFKPINYDVQTVLKNATIKVNFVGIKKTKIRIRIACFLFRCATFVLGCEIEFKGIETEKCQKSVRKS